jgi:hypothetical protein
VNRTIRWLALLLAVQLLLAVGLSRTGPDLTASAERAPLLSLERAAVDRIRLEGPEDAAVTLRRADDAWTLTELDGFPADTTKVDQLLARLTELQGGIPAATSAAARVRFRVAEDDFERRIHLYSGEETLATLYLGSSPGMGQIHARAGASDVIQVVKLAAFDIPVKADDWIDRLMLRVSRQRIAAIELDGLRIERAADAAAAEAGDQPAPHWQAAGLAEGEQLDQQAADTLAERLSELSIGAVLGREAKAEYGLSDPALELSVTAAGGEPVSYRIGRSADGQQFTLQASSRPEYFRVPSYTAEQLLEAANREALISTAAETAAEETADAAAAAPATAETEATPTAESAAGD